MKRVAFAWICIPHVQLLLLVGLVFVAIIIWVTRNPSPTVVIGDRDVVEITTEIAEAISNQHGELCEEHGIGDFVGEFLETELTSVSALPTSAAALVNRVGMTASDYQQKHLSSERIVLVFRAANDQPPAKSKILAHAVELKLFVNVDPDGTRPSSPECVETESSALYPCD